MKLIVRIDDIGYTDINNAGAFLAIEKGIATAADVMLDTPGTKDALLRLKEMPWISVGWHMHFWGRPVLPKEQVPSLVGENGHFKPDMFKQEGISYSEAMAELRAELMLCQRILGRMPAYCATISGNGVFTKAAKDICKEFGIVMDFMTCIIGKEFMPDLPPDKRTLPASREWADRKIICPPAPFAGTIFTDSFEQILKYEELSKNYYLEDPDHLMDQPEDVVTVTVWHPGYVDDYMINEGEPGQMARHFDHVRYWDINTLCSKEYYEWVRDNRIELMNFTDALYGRRDYQNHLAAAGSELAL